MKGKKIRKGEGMKVKKTRNREKKQLTKLKLEAHPYGLSNVTRAIPTLKIGSNQTTSFNITSWLLGRWKERNKKESKGDG